MGFRNHCFVAAASLLAAVLVLSCSEERSYGTAQAGASGEGTAEGGEGGTSESSAGGAESGGASQTEAGVGGEPELGGSGGTGVEEPPLCEPSAAPARLLAPLSSSVVTNRRPTLSWELGDDCGALRVELCADRACDDVITGVDVAEDARSAKPKVDLPQGTVFWRVRGSGVASRVWQLNVGLGTPADTSWGTLPDFNGDGFGDVAVGTSNRGAFVYYGSSNGLESEPTPLTVAGGATDAFGALMASAGDVNGDGFTDLLVGAAKKTSGGADSKLYVFAGGADGVAAEPFAVLDAAGLVHDSDPQYPSGSGLRGGADINQDGYGDFVLTTPEQNAAAGSFTIFFGSADDVTEGPKTVAPGIGYSFGTSVAFCDLDTDGLAELVVGASGVKSATDEPTNTLLYPANGTAFGTASSLPAPEAYGATVACGDYNADGYPDVVTADPQSGARGYNYGDVMLFRDGSVTSGEFLPNMTTDSYGWAGQFMATVGDMNGDGFQELVVGGQDGQSLRVLFDVGSAKAADTVVLSGSGIALTSADVNGDALVDLIAGTPDIGTTGRITVYLGSEAGGVASPAHIDGPPGSTGFGVELASSF